MADCDTRNVVIHIPDDPTKPFCHYCRNIGDVVNYADIPEKFGIASTFCNKWCYEMFALHGRHGSGHNHTVKGEPQVFAYSVRMIYVFYF